jgi:hypothetical protein
MRHTVEALGQFYALYTDGQKVVLEFCPQIYSFLGFPIAGRIYPDSSSAPRPGNAGTAEYITTLYRFTIPVYQLLDAGR